MKIFKISIALTIIILITLLYTLFFTTSGSLFCFKAVLSVYLGAQNIAIDKAEGSFSKKLILQEISFDKLKWLPEDSKLEVQNLEVFLNPFNLKGKSIDIKNGRLKISGANIILFYGNYRNNLLDFNIYFKDIDIEDILETFVKDKALKGIGGTISDSDIKVKGLFSEPELTGSFKIEKLYRNDISLLDSSGEIKLIFKDIENNIKIYGDIEVKTGKIKGKRSAVIIVNPSKIIFSGDPKMPSFDAKGLAKVEDTKIDITLKGTVKEPDLKLSSNPPYPQDKIVLMLMTNKSWAGTENSLMNKGQDLGGVSRDLADYFIFGGSENKIMQYFQEKGITFKYDNNTIGTEYNVTDTIAVGAEKELVTDKKDNENVNTPPANNKVILKYKKDF